MPGPSPRSIWLENRRQPAYRRGFRKELLCSLRREIKERMAALRERGRMLRRYLLGMLVGLCCGLLLHVLLAPRPGCEWRRSMQEQPEGRRPVLPAGNAAGGLAPIRLADPVLGHQALVFDSLLASPGTHEQPAPLPPGSVFALQPGMILAAAEDASKASGLWLADGSFLGLEPGCILDLTRPGIAIRRGALYAQVSPQGQGLCVDLDRQELHLQPGSGAMVRRHPLRGFVQGWEPAHQLQVLAGAVHCRRTVDQGLVLAAGRLYLVCETVCGEFPSMPVAADSAGRGPGANQPRVQVRLSRNSRRVSEIDVAMPGFPDSGLLPMDQGLLRFFQGILKQPEVRLALRFQGRNETADASWP